MHKGDGAGSRGGGSRDDLGLIRGRGRGNGRFLEGGEAYDGGESYEGYDQDYEEGGAFLGGFTWRGQHNLMQHAQAGIPFLVTRQGMVQASAKEKEIMIRKRLKA